MHRQILAKTLLVVCVFALLCEGSSFAQDNNQTIPVTMPPNRRIEPPPANATPQDLDERGDQLRGEKAYLDAIDYYQAGLKKLNSKGELAAVLYNKIGITQMQLGRWFEARKSFERSIKTDKNYPKSYNNLAVVYYQGKKYPRAIKYYKRALSFEPDNPSYHSNLGSAYFAHKDLDSAMAEYARALQLDPEIFERRSSVGIVAQMSSPEDRAHFSYVLAKMYAQMGEFDRSLLYLRRAIEEGYKDINNVYQDGEFARLRKDERFNALMAQPPTSIP